MRIKELDVDAGKPCKHCNNGCTVHTDQPADICSSFKCSWLEGNVSYEMRPDIIGAIILPGNYIWMNHSVDMAIPTGQEIPPRSMQKLMKEYKGRLLITEERYVKDGKPCRSITPHGPQAFINDIVAMANEGHKFNQ